MYYGEVNVENDSLPEFLKTAEMLQIKGLTKSNSSESSINSAQNLAESDYDTFDMKKIKTDCESFDETSSNHTVSNLIINASRFLFLQLRVKQKKCAAVRS